MTRLTVLTLLFCGAFIFAILTNFWWPFMIPGAACLAVWVDQVLFKPVEDSTYPKDDS